MMRDAERAEDERGGCQHIMKSMKSRVTSVPSAAVSATQRADTKDRLSMVRLSKVGDIGQIHRSGRERLKMHRERHVDEQRGRRDRNKCPYSSMIHNSRKMVATEERR